MRAVAGQAHDEIAGPGARLVPQARPAVVTVLWAKFRVRGVNSESGCVDPDGMIRRTRAEVAVPAAIGIGGEPEKRWVFCAVGVVTAITVLAFRAGITQMFGTLGVEHVTTVRRHRARGN